MTKVLVVEDDVTTQFMMCELIETLGYDCSVVSSGTECLSRLSTDDHGINLVLLDLHMPGMDGLTAARAIREKEPSPERAIPIVAVTADTAFHEPQVAVAYGMTDVLPKPIDLRALDLAIRTHAA